MSAKADDSWSVDLPGLNQAGAAAIMTFAKDSGVCELASAVDPSLFLTLHLDRETVEPLLRLIADRGAGRDDWDEVALQGISEIFEEWLSFVASDLPRRSDSF